MVNVNDFKTGMTIIVNDKIFQVLEFLHVKPGKGGAFVRTKLKNLRDGSIIDHTFNAGIKVPKALVEKKIMQYLYNTGNNYIFMDNETYEQVELDINYIKDHIKYLKENLMVELVFYKHEILDINLPEKIEFKVIKTEQAVRGNTANKAMKDAVIETDYTIKVPLFIEEGEIIIISTKDGKYVSRK